MHHRIPNAFIGLAAFVLLAPAQSWAGCNTDSMQTNAVSAYELNGQGNFNCSALNMTEVSASITNPSTLGGKGIDWTGSDIDAVAVADSSGKRCVYNYGGGATGGQGLTPSSNKSATEIFVCADANTVEPPNAPPTVTIDSPSDAATFSGGASIHFLATADDTEDGSLDADIVWTSSLDGSIGQGNSLSKTLTAGIHIITALVRDSEGLVGADDVTITVEAVEIAQCEQADDGSFVLINGTQVMCPTDDAGGFLPRVVCSADISDNADKFELENQGCCVCGVTATECNPELPAGATVAEGQPGPCPVVKAIDNLQVPTSIMFNNDPYYCVTIGGRRTCYAY